MEIKKFKNGNFNIRIEKGEFENVGDFIVSLCDSIEADFTFVSEEYFNVGGYYVLFNFNTRLFYNVPDKEITGGTVKLWGYKDTEREEELEKELE